MRQVEKENMCYTGLNHRYDRMIKDNEGNLILNSNRANLGC